MRTNNRIRTGHATMKIELMTLVAAALLLFSSTGWSSDHDGEATIRLMDAAEAESPDAVTKQISIPTHLMKAGVDAQQRAVENAAKGLEKANERDARSDKGQLKAEDARDRSAEMSEKARETRENRGRAEDDPEPPEGPPGPP